MKNIDGRLNALEKQAKGKRHQEKYCTVHAPHPVIVFDESNPPEIPENCHICGKPYPPDTRRVIIDFTDMGINDTWG